MNFQIITTKLLIAFAISGALAGCNGEQSTSQTAGGNVSSTNSGESFSLNLRAQPSYKLSSGVVLDFSATNNTNQSVQFLKWGTPFESRLTRDMFHVTRNGSVLPYHGIMVKRGRPQESDYITIPAGKTISHRVNLSQAYSIDASGTYQAQYKESYPKLKRGMELKAPASSLVTFQVTQ